MSEGEGTPMDEDPTEEDLVRGRGNRKNNESDWCQVGKNGRVVKNVAGLGENRQRQTPGQYDQPPAKKECLGQSSIEGQERRPNSTLLGRDLPSGPLLTHLNIRDSSPGSTGLVEALTMLQAMRAPPRPPSPPQSSRESSRAPSLHLGSDDEEESMTSGETKREKAERHAYQQHAQEGTSQGRMKEQEAKQQQQQQQQQEEEEEVEEVEEEVMDQAFGFSPEASL
jgi:hypothetical protein